MFGLRADNIRPYKGNRVFPLSFIVVIRQIIFIHHHIAGPN